MHVGNFLVLSFSRDSMKRGGPKYCKSLSSWKGEALLHEAYFSSRDNKMVLQ